MKNLLIYVVDDDEDDRYILRKAFEEHPAPCSITEFEDGQDLVDHIDAVALTLPPNLVVLDLNMPRMNGFDALTYLRSQPDWQSVPVAVLTTSDDDGDRRRSLELGASAYMVKPPNYANMMGIIQQGVELAREDASLSGPSLR